MAYVATVDFTGKTMDDYWRVQEGYADQPIAGLVALVAGPAERSMRIVSIWASKAHHDRFVAERLHPILSRLGMPKSITVSDFAAEDLLVGPAASQTPRGPDGPADGREEPT